MSFEVQIVLKTTLILALAGVMSAVLSRGSAAVRHAIWALALSGVLVFPAASLVVPDVEVALLPAEHRETAAATISGTIPQPVIVLPREVAGAAAVPSDVSPVSYVEGPEKASFSWSRRQWIAVGWVAGALAVFSLWMHALWMLHVLKRRSRLVPEQDWQVLCSDVRKDLAVRSHPEVRIADGPAPPMTWGVFRQVILLPAAAESWPASRRRLVLAHEMAHVKRRDSLGQILSQIVLALYWFNPVVWYAVHRLRVERERACDDIVLRLGVPAADYADHLVGIARGLNSGFARSTLSMAHPTQLKFRVLAILDSRLARRRVSWPSAALLFVVVATLTLSIATIHLTSRVTSAASPVVPPPPLPQPAPGVLQGQVEPQSVKEGVIEVIVRDSTTGQPIPGARITFVLVQTPPPNIVTYVNAGQNGQAVFDGLAPGTYRVDAEMAGYIQRNVVSTLRRVIGPESARHEVEVQLTRGATVGGRILDANGVPITNARITLAIRGYRDGQLVMLSNPQGNFLEIIRGLRGGFPMLAPSSTNDRGEYLIAGAPPGTYYVQASLQNVGEDGWSGYWDDYPKVTYYHPGVTEPRAAVPVTIRGPQDITGIDLQLPRVPVFRISGTVINPFPGGDILQNGQPGRLVTSYYLAPTDLAAAGEPILAASRVRPSANPDESIFEISGVPPGSYYLFPVWRSESEGAGAAVTKRTLLQIDDHDIEGLRIVLSRNNQLKGRVLFDGARTDQGLTGLRVGLTPTNVLPAPLNRIQSAPVPDPEVGEFTLTNLPEGRFGVTVQGLPPNAYVAGVLQGVRNAFDEGILAGGDNEPVEVLVSFRGGTLQGVVRDPKGSPVASAGITLVPAFARRNNPRLYKRTTADGNGQFILRGIAPGEYKVFAWPALPEGQAEQNAGFIAPFENRGVSVNVVAGVSSTVQADVIPLP
jgi:beta-lactamase regulating signal transducer with metallopeptidase domain/protocatechuate 3,4-dioxygenase beta subunit